eukprot:g5101.t1
MTTGQVLDSDPLACKNVPRDRFKYSGHHECVVTDDPAGVQGSPNVTVGGQPCGTTTNDCSECQVTNKRIDCKMEQTFGAKPMPIVVSAYGLRLVLDAKFAFLPAPCPKGSGLDESNQCMPCAPGRFSITVAIKPCDACGAASPTVCGDALSCPVGSKLPQPVLPGEILRPDGTKEVCDAALGYFCNRDNINSTQGALQIATVALEVSGREAALTTEQVHAMVVSGMHLPPDHVAVQLQRNASRNSTTVEVEVFVERGSGAAARNWLQQLAGSIEQRVGGTSVEPVGIASVDMQRGVCAHGYVLTLGSANGALACTPCSKHSAYCPTSRHVGLPLEIGEGNYSVLQLVDRQWVAVGQEPCHLGHYCRGGTQQACAIGAYQDERAQTGCKACAAPYFGNDTNLTTSTCSGVCPARHECVDGRLSGRCAEWLVVSESARCTACKANEFAFHSAVYPQWAAEIVGNDSCVECPHTPYGEAKCGGELLEFEPGFWHSGTEWVDPETQTTLAHVTKESLGWRPPGARGVRRGNAGILCAVCTADHYKRTDTGRCVACSDANIVDDFPWVPLLVLLGFIAFFVGSDARAEWRRLRALQRHIQGCQQLLVGKSKIVLGFFQVLLLTKNIYRVPFPQVFIEFMDKLAFLRFELFKLVPVRCVVPFTFHDILDAVVVTSFVLVLPPWFKLLQEYAGVCQPSDQKLRKLTNTIVTWLLVLTYLLYPTMSSLLFQAFSCETVHLGRFLHQDLSIDCDSAAHKYYERLTTVMVSLFAFGVPVLYWALLRRHRHNLLHNDAQYLSFFFADYTDEFWYWEVVECFRKLALTGAALFFGEQGSLLQAAVAITLMMLYIPVLIKAQPYALPSDNAVALLVNLGLLFVLFSSLLLKVKTAFAPTGRFGLGYTEDTLGYLLIFVALVVLVAARVRTT